MRYATSTGSGRDRERTEYGELLADLRTACQIGSATAVRTAQEAIDRYHATRGGRVPGATGGRSLVPDIESIRRQIAELGRATTDAVADARATRATSTTARLAVPATGAGFRLEYDDEADDDTDFEAVTTENESRREFLRQCG